MSFLITKVRFVCLILVYVIHHQGVGQDSVVLDDPSTLQTRPSQLKAKNYLDRNWKAANIYLFNGHAFMDQQMRYDMDNNLLEVKLGDEIKMIQSYKARRFEWIEPNGSHEVYTNCAGYESSEWIEGFYRVLEEGDLTLLEKTSIKEEDDAVATGFGTKNVVGAADTQRFVEDDAPDELEVTLYLGLDGNAYPIGRKRETLIILKEKAPEVEKYAKENHLGFRDHKDLVKIVSYYNNLP